MHQHSDGQLKHLTSSWQRIILHRSWFEDRRKCARKADFLVDFGKLDRSPKDRQALASYGDQRIPKFLAGVSGTCVFQEIILLRKKIVCLILAMLSPFSVYALGVGTTDSGSAWTYSGWVCDPAVPGYQSEVQAKRDDGEVLGRVVAGDVHETSMPSACRSSHNAHGFRLDIEQKARWADGKYHDVTLYSVDPAGNKTPFSTFSVQFSSSAEDVPSPRAAGDIVGRELDYKKAAFSGHIGIWDGAKVIEVLDEKGASKVYRNSWENFKSRSKVWNTVHPNYPMHTIETCWAHTCDVNLQQSGGLRVSAQQAVILRATQIYMIGADYTLGLYFTAAEPELRNHRESQWRKSAVRGMYRCDTFVYDAFVATTDKLSFLNPPRYVYNMDKSWKENVSSLYGFALTLPSSMLEKIRNF